MCSVSETPLPTPTTRRAFVCGPIDFSREYKTSENIPMVAQHLLVETRRQGKPQMMTRSQAFNDFRKQFNKASQLLAEVGRRLEKIRT
jgi:hypothetical protein